MLSNSQLDWFLSDGRVRQYGAKKRVFSFSCSLCILAPLIRTLHGCSSHPRGLESSVSVVGVVIVDVAVQVLVLKMVVYIV